MHREERALYYANLCGNCAHLLFWQWSTFIDVELLHASTQTKIMLWMIPGWWVIDHWRKGIYLLSVSISTITRKWGYTWYWWSLLLLLRLLLLPLLLLLLPLLLLLLLLLPLLLQLLLLLLLLLLQLLLLILLCCINTTASVTSSSWGSIRVY